MSAEIQQLKESLQFHQNRLAKVEGTMESIEAQWEKELGTRDPEGVKAILARMEKELMELEALQTETLAQVRKLLEQANAC